jgi:hypothetical protein
MSLLRCSYKYRRGPWARGYCGRRTTGGPHCQLHKKVAQCGASDCTPRNFDILPAPTHALSLTVEPQWLTCYAAMTLEMNGPVMEAISAYFEWVQRSLDALIHPDSIRITADPALRALMHDITEGSCTHRLVPVSPPQVCDCMKVKV